MNKSKQNVLKVSYIPFLNKCHIHTYFCRLCYVPLLFLLLTYFISDADIRQEVRGRMKTEWQSPAVNLLS